MREDSFVSFVKFDNMIQTIHNSGEIVSNQGPDSLEGPMALDPFDCTTSVWKS